MEVKSKITRLNKSDCLTLSWSDPDIGFGEFELLFLKDGRLMISTERMGKEFIMKVLEELVKDAILIN